MNQHQGQVSGNVRWRLPFNTNSALHKAGAKGGTPISPTPPIGLSDVSIATST